MHLGKFTLSNCLCWKLVWELARVLTSAPLRPWQKDLGGPHSVSPLVSALCKGTGHYWDLCRPWNSLPKWPTPTSTACLPAWGVSPQPPFPEWLLLLLCALLSQGMAREQLSVGDRGCGKNLDMGLRVHMDTWGCSPRVALFLYQTSWSLRSLNLNMASQFVMQIYLFRDKGRRLEHFFFFICLLIWL